MACFYRQEEVFVETTNLGVSTTTGLFATRGVSTMSEIGFTGCYCADPFVLIHDTTQDIEGFHLFNTACFYRQEEGCVETTNLGVSTTTGLFTTRGVSTMSGDWVYGLLLCGFACSDS
jgi:hypothetical protein